MIAAGGEGNLWVLVVMAVIGIINWLSSRKADSAPKPPAPRAPSPAPRQAAQSSEEERMRRFLEALGVPSEAPRPVPPVVAPPQRPKPPQPQQQRERKRKKPQPPPIPESRSLDELPAPERRVAEIEIPELSVSAMPELRGLQLPAGALPASSPETTTAPAASRLGELVRAELSSPERLRSAFLLREILGPPKALQ